MALRSCSKSLHACLVHVFESSPFQVAALVQADKERGFGDVKLEALLDWNEFLRFFVPFPCDCKCVEAGQEFCKQQSTHPMASFAVRFHYAALKSVVSLRTGMVST